jgi:hypothetical protein
VGANPKPRASESFSRSQWARASNDAIARSAARLHFVSRVPFLCECERDGCEELVLLTGEEFAASKSGLITAPHHANPRAPQQR